MLTNLSHFSDVTLLVGFTALVGVSATKSAWRIVFFPASD
jgi:hypothetical protein